MYAIQYPLNRCVQRGIEDFYAGNIVNRYGATPDGHMSMSAKEWQRGFDRAYLDNKAETA